jgi:ABC-type lipoprotein release transport system permease subunit
MMKRSRFHIVSYFAALLIGTILFATVWRWIFGSASSPVVGAGIAGVAFAVVLFSLWNGFRKQKDNDD